MTPPHYWKGDGKDGSKAVGKDCDKDGGEAGGKDGEYENEGKDCGQDGVGYDDGCDDEDCGQVGGGYEDGGNDECEAGGEVKWWIVNFLRGFDLWRTDVRTDICDCRVAFATEKFEDRS